MTYRDVVKNPIIEDIEYCENGTHCWIMRDDKSIYCYNCKVERKKK